MLELFSGSLDTKALYDKWHVLASERNFGACLMFTGVVRDEEGISGLSFDLYEPILRAWFERWQEKAKAQGALFCMAHSIGDVPNHESSFAAAILSPKRRVALEMIEQFVEDFKANAPIWKYDLKEGERIYARARSHKIEGSGILA